MKLILTLLLCLLFFYTCAPKFRFSNTYFQVDTSQDNVKIRRGPGLRYTEIYKIARYDLVLVKKVKIIKNEDWAMVKIIETPDNKFKKITGFIKRDLLLPEVR